MSKFYGADDDKVAQVLASSRQKLNENKVETHLVHPGAVMRLVTYIIDSGLYTLLSYLVVALVVGSHFDLETIEQFQTRPELMQAWIEEIPVFDIFFAYLAVWFVYYIGFVGVFSTTPAKYLFGMKIISSMSGGDIGYLMALWRTICLVFSFVVTMVPIVVVAMILPPVIFLMFAAYIYLAIHPALDSQKRALHDKFAGTEVIYQ